MESGIKLSDLKLSKTQLRAFKKLIKVGGWVSPYDIKESIGTLNSLFHRDLCKRKYELGSMAFPRNETYYKSKYNFRR